MPLSSVDPLYQVKVTCQHCHHPFQTSRVRASFKKGISRDTDFCIHYQDPEINPDFYVVRVCPVCGFASTESFQTKLTDRQKTDYMNKVSQHWKTKDYGGKRTWEEALQSYKLALISAQICGESHRLVAGILHHIAWLYRYQKEEAQESRFLQYALDAYIKVFELEGTNNDAKLMYMIGELNRRLKKYMEAVQWFGRVINDHSIMDAAMIQASREQWKQVREEMKADQIELTEELDSSVSS